jgi:hypothetical protein
MKKILFGNFTKQEIIEAYPTAKQMFLKDIPKELNKKVKIFFTNMSEKIVERIENSVVFTILFSKEDKNYISK